MKGDYPEQICPFDPKCSVNDLEASSLFKRTKYFFRPVGTLEKAEVRFDLMTRDAFVLARIRLGNIIYAQEMKLTRFNLPKRRFAAKEMVAWLQRHLFCVAL